MKWFFLIVTTLISANLSILSMQYETKNGVTHFYVPRVFNGFGDDYKQCILDHTSGNVNCYQKSNARQPLNLEPQIAKAMYFELLGRFKNCQ